METPGRGEDIGPIGLFAGLSLASAAWMWIYGMIRADPDFANSLWQLQRVAYLPLLVFLFQFALEVDDRRARSWERSSSRRRA